MNQRETTDQLKERNLKRYKIVVWTEEGVNKSEIARRLEVDRKDIYRTLEKFDTIGSVEMDLREDNPGRPPLFNERDKEDLRAMIIEEEGKNFDEIIEMVEERMEKNASRSTYSRVLSDIGRFVTPTWTPNLTQDHRDERLRYCRYHINHKTSFKHVIFTDEARFYMNRKTKKVFFFPFFLSCIGKRYLSQEVNLGLKRRSITQIGRY